ncbi:uncharacterized protein BX663DRAFT_475984 [Cokeromyces recurvatus]|uniref:uncharacterized protein n=1 Tax=Cokeromyces recurvatus TaxID=90255 RepID=UPI00221F6E0B|nr:uncharacterized protein BX663DRAFT_475984 [Cokeromyces recurvatus]KAI7900968.1 hypothetical protein BX663DRAFT_475984 [Cokeromyces recurvatus]
MMSILKERHLFYDNIWTTQTPLFFIPTILFIFVSVIGLFRYNQTRHVPWKDVFSPLVSPQERLSPLSKLIVYLAATVTFSFLLDSFILLARVMFDSHLAIMTMYYIGIAWLTWVIALICLMDESHKFSRWYWSQYLFFLLAAFGETIIGWLWLMNIYKPKPGTVFTMYDRFAFAIFCIRYILEVSIAVLSMIQLINTKRHIKSRNATESSPLLNSTANYGTTHQEEEAIDTKKDKKGGFQNFWKKLKKVMPFIWPHKNYKLQNLVVICFLLMLFGLMVNVWTPLQIGRVVDQFSREPETFAWLAVCAYVGFKFLQGGSGLVQAVQNWLWIPVGQFTTREISVKLFAHLHNLSLHYHINRKTGEVLRVVDRGTNSVVQLLSQIVFQMFPALANILIAVVVFSIQFSIPFGFIVFVTMSLYLYTTIRMTEWRTGFRRKMIELDNFARTKAVDSLLNFETVKYYNAEEFEVTRYDNAIVAYQKADYINSVSLNVLNLTQNAVITAGLLAGSLLFAWEVYQDRLTPGDFVSFNVYMMQLYTPLHFFGTYYRMIQQNFIDMEKMFDLFEVEETVKDAPDAGELVVTEGHVKFDHVSFSYDNRQTALNSISFEIPQGKTVALVGPSGGGKSTILRLLFRFYDPASGHVYIDGQDIASVKQTSLRQNIGVVPQDTVLFNDTIMYNIRYGRVDASDEDVYRAAKAAQIHDKILSFPEGYDTKVGERGLRLSGGEKQRVAIARTILKDPAIILLDEATSALDTTTERHIQEALSEMTKGRTTLVIAHRLSTIVNADLILVIKDGQVMESGNHESLIHGALNGENKGIYYEMWQKQLEDPHEGSATTVGTANSGTITPKINVIPPKPALTEEPTSLLNEEETNKKQVVKTDAIQTKIVSEEEKKNENQTNEDQDKKDNEENENVGSSSDVNQKEITTTSPLIQPAPSMSKTRRNKKKKKRSKSTK